MIEVIMLFTNIFHDIVKYICYWMTGKYEFSMCYGVQIGILGKQTIFNAYDQFFNQVKLKINEFGLS